MRSCCLVVPFLLSVSYVKNVLCKLLPLTMLRIRAVFDAAGGVRDGADIYLLAAMSRLTSDSAALAPPSPCTLESGAALLARHGASPSRG